MSVDLFVVSTMKAVSKVTFHSQKVHLGSSCFSREYPAQDEAYQWKKIERRVAFSNY
jgi:hypothetical protein